MRGKKEGTILLAASKEYHFVTASDGSRVRINIEFPKQSYGRSDLQYSAIVSPATIS